MTDQLAPRAIPFLRTPAAPTLLAMGVAAALGLLALAQVRADTGSMAPVAAPERTAPEAGTAFAEAEAAGLLTRTSAPVAAGTPAARPATYTAGPGEDLAAIATRLYGDPALAPRIAAANRATLEGGLRPGMVLLIPTP